MPVLCAAAVALLAVLLSYWLYSLHFLVLENLPFREARKRSRRLGAGRPDIILDEAGHLDGRDHARCQAQVQKGYEE